MNRRGGGICFETSTSKWRSLSGGIRNVDQIFRGKITWSSRMMSDIEGLWDGTSAKHRWTRFHTSSGMAVPAGLLGRAPRCTKYTTCASRILSLKGGHPEYIYDVNIDNVEYESVLSSKAKYLDTSAAERVDVTSLVWARDQALEKLRGHPPNCSANMGAQTHCTCIREKCEAEVPNTHLHITIDQYISL